jgi:hypothetical protein
MLLSPVVLRLVGPPSRAEVYKAVPLSAGEYPFVERQIFEERSDLDMVFVCSSLLAAAIDAPTVQRELSRALGREANVVVLGANWQGLDLQYSLLRDLLDHRKARMVVMSMPIPEFTSDRPHVQAFRWLRFGDYPEVLSSLPARSKFILYAEYVLGAPRQWLSLVRPNRIDPARARLYEGTLGTVYQDTGYYGAPFVREDREPPQIPPGVGIYSAATAAQFDFHGRPLGPYQIHFARELAGPLRRAGAWLTLLHVPVADERGMTVVPERMFWPDIIPVPMSIAGIPAGTIFAGKTAEQHYHYFFDQHMNSNGMMLFTRAITPTLVRIYEEHVREEEHIHEAHIYPDAPNHIHPDAPH